MEFCLLIDTVTDLCFWMFALLFIFFFLILPSAPTSPPKLKHTGFCTPKVSLSKPTLPVWSSTVGKFVLTLSPSSWGNCKLVMFLSSLKSILL